MAEHSIWPEDKISTKFEIRIEFRLCSADPAELGKTCSDRSSVWWEGRARLGEPIEAFNSTPENSEERAELIWSKIGRVLSGVLILPKFAEFNRREEDGICNSCSMLARGCIETDLSRSDCSGSLPLGEFNNC